MIEHIWTVVCSRSVIDSETNNISLLEVLEQLTVEPSETRDDSAAIPINFEVVSFWGRTDEARPGKGRVNIRLVNSAGDSLAEIPYDIDLESYPRIRVKTKFFGFPPAVGRYHFIVQLTLDNEEEWKDMAKIPLNVITQAKEETNGGEIIAERGEASEQ